MVNTAETGGVGAPLAGIRILDLTQNLPGPYATLVLAGLGAEVIKIEPPRGDTARNVPAFFALTNRGKKSLALDLKTTDGVDALKRLVPTADVLIEGFRPGVMESLGLGPDVLLPLREGLVYCRVSGFGQTGPYREHPSHDLNLQALTGVCAMTRDEHAQPAGAALPIADLSAGLTASNAVLAALLGRQDRPEGAVLDIALSDAVMGWAHLWAEGLTPSAPDASKGVRGLARLLERKGRGGLASRLRGLDPDKVDAAGRRLRQSRIVDALARQRLHALPHYAVYETRDGRHLAVGIVDEDKFWRALCETLGLGAFGQTPLPGRLLLSAPLRAALRRVFRRRTLSQWMESLPRHEVPVTPVLHVHEAPDDAQLRTRIPEGLGVPVLPPALCPAALGPAPALDADSALLSR